MMMLGYIHKDQSLPHFRVVLHNINPNEIIKGIAEWQTAKLSYEDDKIMLTKANLFHRLSKRNQNSIHKCHAVRGPEVQVLNPALFDEEF